MKSLFVLFVGIVAGVFASWLIDKSASTSDIEFAVLFAPYRVEREFLSVLPNENNNIVSQLVNISNSREGWQMATISKDKKITVFPFYIINMEPPTNSSIIIWRPR